MVNSIKNILVSRVWNYILDNLKILSKKYFNSKVKMLAILKSIKTH